MRAVPALADVGIANNTDTDGGLDSTVATVVRQQTDQRLRSTALIASLTTQHTYVRKWRDGVSNQTIIDD